MADFSLSETQQEMVRTAQEFGREVLEPAEFEIDRMASPDEAFAGAVFRETMAAAFDLGFHKMTLPEEHGGLGLGPATAGLVWEELARYGIAREEKALQVPGETSDGEE